MQVRACSIRCSVDHTGRATPITGQFRLWLSSSRYSARSVIFLARSPVIPKMTSTSACGLALRASTTRPPARPTVAAGEGFVAARTTLHRPADRTRARAPFARSALLGIARRCHSSVVASTDDGGGYEVLAVRYGTRQAWAHEVFLNFHAYGEPDRPLRMDYFFWVIRGAGRTVVVDTGFSAEAGAAR